MPATSSAQRRIAQLATLTAVHRAFHWLHLHQPQLRQWLLEIVRIPAPPFGESARAAWFLERFQQLGLTNPHLDDAGNVLAELASDLETISAKEPDNPPHLQSNKSSSSDPFLSEKSAVAPIPVVLLSAHLDTVFPAGTPTEPTE